MKDFLGQEVFIDDIIVFSDSKYADLNLGVIIKINPKSITAKYLESNSFTQVKKTTIKCTEQFVKIDKEICEKQLV